MTATPGMPARLCLRTFLRGLSGLRERASHAGIDAISSASRYWVSRCTIGIPAARQRLKKRAFAATTRSARSAARGMVATAGSRCPRCKSMATTAGTGRSTPRSILFPSLRGRVQAGSRIAQPVYSCGIVPDSRNELSPGARVAIGVAMLALGAGVAAVGAQTLLADPKGLASEGLIGVPIGMVFALGGLMLAVPARFARLRAVAAAVLVTSMALTADWIAF